MAPCVTHCGECRSQHAAGRLYSRCASCAVWVGALVGIGCAILVGTVFIVLFYVAKRTIFKGAGQAIFEGFLELIAAFMLTFLAFAMLKVKGYEEKWRLKLESAAVKVLRAPRRILPA